MLFDLTHTLYIVVSLLATAGLLILFSRFRSPSAKSRVLKITGIVTLTLHVSSIWVEFLIRGKAEAYSNILFPIFFCNFLMYCLLICGSVRNKESVGFRWLATFTAYGGTIGALISLFYPDFYLSQPDFWDWGILKSFLSHSTMMLGCLYLFTGGFVKIRVFNLIPYAAGLLAAGLDGFLINGLFAVCGLESPNAMFLQKSALDGIPFFNGYGIALLMVILIFLFTAVWEIFACPKGARWYDFLRKKHGKRFESLK